MIIKNHNSGVKRSIFDQVVLGTDWITKAVKGDISTSDTDFANHFSVYGLNFFFLLFCHFDGLIFDNHRTSWNNRRLGFILSFVDNYYNRRKNRYWRRPRDNIKNRIVLIAYDEFAAVGYLFHKDIGFFYLLDDQAFIEELVAGAQVSHHPDFF
jgi:hypothetical protein